MGAALRDYSDKIYSDTYSFVSELPIGPDREEIARAVSEEVRHLNEVTPYKFHVSEDIYTSILLHSDTNRAYKSVLHPHIESKMLSPQDLTSWTLQRFKYAGGSLDIFFHDNPLFKQGMTTAQKFMYAMTFYSYLSPLWNLVFIAAPLIALFTGISPVDAYSSDFFLHLLPFLIVHELASMMGTWGIDNRKGRMLNLAFFWINLRAIWTVILGKEIKFHVTPKERIDKTDLSLVHPQLFIIGLTLIGLVYAGTLAFSSGDAALIGSFVVNGFWASINAYSMTVLVSAALWTPAKQWTSEQPINKGARI